MPLISKSSSPAALRRLNGMAAQLLQPAPAAAAPSSPEPAAQPGGMVGVAGSELMRVAPMTGTFGARIENVDLASLTPQQANECKQALSKYKLLVIDGQDHITPTQLRDFADHWGRGESAKHPTHKQVEGCPEVYIIQPKGSLGNFQKMVNGMRDPRATTNIWHRDGPPRERTEWLSFLHAKDVPESGRDTIYADAEAAYERLSPALRQYLDTLSAQNDWGPGQMPTAGPDYPKNGYAHPVVMVDEEGRKSIYVDGTYTRKVNGLRKEESDWMLAFLNSLTNIPELQCRVSWKPGTLVVWDNEKTWHYIVRDNDYDRVLHRIMVNARPLDSKDRGQNPTKH